MLCIFLVLPFGDDLLFASISCSFRSVSTPFLRTLSASHQKITKKTLIFVSFFAHLNEIFSFLVVISFFLKITKRLTRSVIFKSFFSFFSFFHLFSFSILLFPSPFSLSSYFVVQVNIFLYDTCPHFVRYLPSSFLSLRQETIPFFLHRNHDYFKNSFNLHHHHHHRR